jgi:hypothetical protein
MPPVDRLVTLLSERCVEPFPYYTFGGWKRSRFGDLDQYGPDAMRFYTETNTVTSRWPSWIAAVASIGRNRS